jgi:hypothetical protein
MNRGGTIFFTSKKCQSYNDVDFYVTYTLSHISPSISAEKLLLSKEKISASFSDQTFAKPQRFTRGGEYTRSGTFWARQRPAFTNISWPPGVKFPLRVNLAPRVELLHHGDCSLLRPPPEVNTL